VTETTALSKSQLDRLGSRLRNDAEPTNDDLVLLNRYRQQFLDRSRSVVATLRELSIYPIESRHKSTPSIVSKLRRRQPARLSAIQDMAGARIIVPDTDEQDVVVRRIAICYPDAAIDDKRPVPTFGYRAVHVILPSPLPFEVQIRTEMQHAWAQLSERLADRYGFELKYGGGPAPVRLALLEYAGFGAAVEQLAAEIRRGKASDAAIATTRGYVDRLPSILEALRIE